MNSKNPLSSREITDFIHRFSTESKKVLAVVSDLNTGFFFSLAGKIEVNPEGILMVHGEGAPALVDTPVFVTSTVALLGSVCEFADASMFKGGPFSNFFANDVPFTFGLVFIFRPGAMLCLLEVE
jgi:hypothetical protein